MIGSKVVLLPMRVMGVLIGYFTLLLKQKRPVQKHSFHTGHSGLLLP